MPMLTMITSQDVTVSLLKAAMLEREQANGFLIDGFPREMEQAKIFEENASLYCNAIMHYVHCRYVLVQECFCSSAVMKF